MKPVSRLLIRISRRNSLMILDDAGKRTTYFRIGRPSCPSGEKARSNPFLYCWRASVWFFTTSDGRQEKDNEDIWVRDPRLVSPVMPASVKSAAFIRFSFGISGGMRSDLLCGRRDKNFANTWFAIDACPGTILREPEPPVSCNGTIRSHDFLM